MKKILLALCLMLVAGSASATGTKYLNALTLPYTASTNDTFFVANDAGAVTVLSTAGSCLLIPDGVTGVRVYLLNDTIIFDTDSTGGEYGIRIGTNVNTGTPANDIHIRGGGIRSPIQQSHGRNNTSSSAPTARRCLWIYTGYNITIDTVTCQIDGHDVHVVEWGGGSSQANTTYNITHNGGTYTSHSQSYSDRESYTGSAMYTNNLRSASGNYNVKLYGVNVINSPHVGVVAKGGTFIIDSCKIVIAGRNKYWDTTACYASASCPVGQSTGNAYNILFRQAKDGSMVTRCSLLVSTSEYGGRGIMLESFIDSIRAGDSVVIADNVMILSEGKTGEGGSGQHGNLRIIRIRRANQSVPLSAIVYRIRDNEITGSIDYDTSTHYIGASVVALHMNLSSGDSCGVYWTSNRINIKSLTSNTSAACFPTYLNSTPPAAGTKAGFFSTYNRYIGSRSCLAWGDRDNGGAGNNFLSDRDTFVIIDTNAVGNENVVITNFGTFQVGYSSSTATGNIIRDGVFPTVSGYANQASDTNIVFPGSGASDLTIQRTCSLVVKDNNGDPINGASITVLNAYGNTVVSGLSTDANGVAKPILTYWYEENNVTTSADSTAYNPFTIIASYDANGNGTIVDNEDDTNSLTVSPTNWTSNFTITGADVGGGTQTTVLLVDTVIVDEGGTALVIFSVTPAPSGTDGTVNYATSNGTATAGTNYVSQSGTLTIPIGQSLDTLLIPTIRDGINAGTLDLNYTFSTLWQGTFIDNDSTGKVLIRNIDRVFKTSTRRP